MPAVPALGFRAMRLLQYVLNKNGISVGARFSASVAHETV